MYKPGPTSTGLTYVLLCDLTHQSRTKQHLFGCVRIPCCNDLIYTPLQLEFLQQSLSLIRFLLDLGLNQGPCNPFRINHILLKIFSFCQSLPLKSVSLRSNQRFQITISLSSNHCLLFYIVGSYVQISHASTKYSEIDYCYLIYHCLVEVDPPFSPDYNCSCYWFRFLVYLPQLPHQIQRSTGIHCF